MYPFFFPLPPLPPPSSSNSTQSSCFENILVRIRGVAESEAIRYTRPSTAGLMRFSRGTAPRKLRWKRENSLSLKFRECRRSTTLPLFFSLSSFFLSLSLSFPVSFLSTIEPLTLFLSLGFPPNFRTNLYIFECESGGWIECVSPLQFPSLSPSFFVTGFIFYMYVFFFLFSLFFDSLLLLFRPNFIHGIDAQSGINNISTIGGSIVSVAMEMANENYFASSFPSFFLHFNSNCDRLLLLNVSLNRWLIGGMEIYRQIVPQIILVSRFIRGNKRGAKTRLDVRFESINSFIPGG